MEVYLLDLIERMRTKDDIKNQKPGIYRSDQSISWNAHREAETLADEKYVKQLIEYIPIEKRKTYRDSAYFVLGKLLSKMAIPTAIQFYINRLLIETDKYILMFMLDRLEDIDKDSSIDILPIIQCTKSDKWQIRQSAISALAKTKHETAKEIIRAFVQLEEQKKYKYEIIYAVAVLGMIGEKEDIALLKPLSSSRIRDIRGSAAFAVERLENDGSGLP